MPSRTVTAIIIYAIAVIIAYTVIRVQSDFDDDGGAMALVWMCAIAWPVLAALAIIFIPFKLIGTGIDKIIYSVQTRILEAKNTQEIRKRSE